MALEDIPAVVSEIPSELVTFSEWMILLLKAAGAALVIYIVYLIIKGIIEYRQIQRVKRIEKKMDVLDAKLDYIIKSLGKTNRDKDLKKAKK